MITASELKQKGIKAFEDELKKNDEAIISVRGKDKYVVISTERYKQLLEKDLDIAYKEALDDIKNGRYTTDIEKHLEEIKGV